MLQGHAPHDATKGFTLVEVAIVLVIIGLVAGGILVGRDLINAAVIRAQISQIQKYQTAVNTFRTKYNGLPGDLADPDAAALGFTPRGQYPGEGDGNGILQGVWTDAPNNNYGTILFIGENATFWRDLTTVGLIDGNFNLAWETQPPPISGITSTTTPAIKDYVPQAKLNNNLFVYVYSDQNTNYFAVAQLGSLDTHGPSDAAWAPVMTVQQAYTIDAKIDDGLPQSGKVVAKFVNHGISIPPVWATGGVPTGQGPSDTPPIPATLPGDTTCYDNSGIAGPQHYSTEWKNGSGNNCGLSFQFN